MLRADLQHNPRNREDLYEMWAERFAVEKRAVNAIGPEGAWGGSVYLQERRIFSPKLLAVGISASKSNIRACYFNGSGNALKKALVELRGEGLVIHKAAGSKG